MRDNLPQGTYTVTKTNLGDDILLDATGIDSSNPNVISANVESVNEDKKPVAKIDADDDDAGWTLMGPNAKPVQVLPPAPIPEPVHVPPVAHMPPPNPRPLYATPVKTDMSKVAHNDGSLRVTAKWSPMNFTELLPTDDATWAMSTTDLLHFLFIAASNCSYHPWDPKSDKPILPILLLTPNNIYDYISPNIAAITEHSMYVFGVHVSVCKGGPPGRGLRINQPKSLYSTTESMSALPALPVTAVMSLSSAIFFLKRPTTPIDNTIALTFMKQPLPLFAFSMSAFIDALPKALKSLICSFPVVKRLLNHKPARINPLT